MIPKNRLFALVTLLFLLGAASVQAKGKKESGSEPADYPPDISDYADDGFGMDLSLYFLNNFGYHKLGVGTGVLFAYPALPSGFFDSPVYRDALHVEGGMDFSRWAWDKEGGQVELMIFAPMLGIRYAVYVTNRVAPYLTVKIGAAFARADGVDGDTQFYWNTAAGVLWDFHDRFSLRGEFGWGYYRDVFRIGILMRI
jgi:hypothetical protein